MNQKLIKLWDELTPYKSIIYFLFLLFFFHFSWKILIGGDIEDDYMLFMGKDITPDWFYTARVWLTQAAAWFVHLFPNTDHLIIEDTYLHFPGEIRISIVWGCTGLKQLLIFTGIMVFYRCFTLIKKPGSEKYTFKFLPFWNKLWYIPIGWIILTVYNVMRIGGIVILTNGHHERFESLHDGLFRYIYYTLIFLLWVIWEEVYVKKELKYEKYRKVAVAS
ncbi:MAG: exosortase/archaeosortase family protein [Bacteroidales bacterium]|nr:exosortase/archaeosortase family protein [Bacteroidales bacterium]